MRRHYETTRHTKNCINLIRHHGICRVWDVSLSHLIFPTPQSFFVKKSWVTEKLFVTIWDCISWAMQGICFKMKDWKEPQTVSPQSLNYVIIRLFAAGVRCPQFSQKILHIMGYNLKNTRNGKSLLKIPKWTTLTSLAFKSKFPGVNSIVKPC